MLKPSPYFVSDKQDFTLYQGDCRDIVSELDRQFDMVFADPPYFLSNGGFSVQAGRMVSVDKGEWDKSRGRVADREFTLEWLAACRKVMKPSATIWVCGTFHNIFTVVDVLNELDFRILNVVTWQKSNPPPNLSCRCFTHSTEFIVWARKNRKVPHRYNYEVMRKIAGERQMTDVWRMPAISIWEKTCGKHPTQKPLGVVVRAILSCTQKGESVLDPFAGSCTTGIAANLLEREFVGMDTCNEYLEIGKERRKELDRKRGEWLKKLPDLREI